MQKGQAQDLGEVVEVAPPQLRSPDFLLLWIWVWLLKGDLAPQQ